MSNSGKSGTLDLLLAGGIFVGSAYVGYAYWAPWLGATELLSQIVAVWGFTIGFGLPLAIVAGLSAYLASIGITAGGVAAGGVVDLAVILAAAVPLGAMAVSSAIVPMNTALGGVVAFLAYHFVYLIL